MKITETKIPGAFIVQRDLFKDERGTFTRMFCKRDLKAAGFDSNINQVNFSTNTKKGTLRGLHSQFGDFAEDKLVTCIGGSVYDVCVDVRKDSATYLQYVGVELSVDNGLALYVPKGCAHGYLTLTDDAAVLYFVTQFYTPNSEVGYRFDDKAFNIKWLLPPPYIMSEKDKNWDKIKTPMTSSIS